MYSYVSSFGVAANPAWFSKLPADLQKLIEASVKGVEKEVGVGWDALDDIGKKLLVEGGAEPIKLSSAEDAKFRKAAAEVTEARLKELEARGLPAREAFKLIRSLSEKHARTSRNFWN
jgi:TRAP-type C4-dicarboxylate transport system substrate-binding protein